MLLLVRDKRMKKKKFDFYYDFGSPNAFLAHSIIKKIEMKTGWEALYKPVLLGGIFKLTNNQAPLISFKNVRNKTEYIKKEINRFIKNHNVLYKWNKDFPLRTVELMRTAVFLEKSPHYKDFVDKIFFHIWSEPKKLDDLEIFKNIIEELKLPEKKIILAINTEEIKNKLKEYTNNAVKKGIFGLPSFMIEDELFFGKESIHDLELHILSKDKKKLL